MNGLNGQVQCWKVFLRPNRCANYYNDCCLPTMCRGLKSYGLTRGYYSCCDLTTNVSMMKD